MYIIMGLDIYITIHLWIDNANICFLLDSINTSHCKILKKIRQTYSSNSVSFGLVIGNFHSDSCYFQMNHLFDSYYDIPALITTDIWK